MKYLIAFVIILGLYACKKNQWSFNCNFTNDPSQVFSTQTVDSLFIGTNQLNVGAYQGSRCTFYYNTGGNIPRVGTISSVLFTSIRPYMVSKDTLAIIATYQDTLHPYTSNLKIDSLTLKDVFFLDQAPCLDQTHDTVYLHFSF